MPKFPFTVLLLSLLTSRAYLVTARNHEDFFKICSPSRCSKHGPEIRFPFRLATQPPPCGAPGMQLSCSGQDTILYHPVLGSYKVTAIYYRYGIINASPLADSTNGCPLRRIITKNLSTDVYKPQAWQVASLVGCSRQPLPPNLYGIVGPISCLGNETSQFWYLVYPYTYMSVLPLDCKVLFKSIPMPYSDEKYSTYFETTSTIKEKANRQNKSFKEYANRVISIGETAFTWYSSNITSVCQQCEKEGRHCGFSLQRGQAFCQYHGTVISLVNIPYIFLPGNSRGINIPYHHGISFILVLRILVCQSPIFLC